MSSQEQEELSLYLILRTRMLLASVDDSDANWYIDLLCDIGFLGISTTKPQKFRYSREESERSTLREISKRLAASSSTEETFEINPAFYQVLQID